MDVKSTFEELIKEAGHWLLLRKAVLNKPCACMNRGTILESCGRCNGTGHEYVDHLIRGRRTKMIDSVQMTTDLGLVATPRWHFYLPSNTQPNHKDWLIEIELSATDQEPIVPIKAETYYNITDVESMRDINGKLAYWDVQTEKSNWNV